MIRLDTKATIWSAVHYLYNFSLSVRIAYLFIIVSVFVLVERFLFPSSDRFYAAFALIGAIPSVILAMPVRLVGMTTIPINRKKIIEAFELRGFRVHELTENRIHLRKTLNPYLEWNERRVIIEYDEQGFRAEILLCDRMKLGSLLFPDK